MLFFWKTAQSSDCAVFFVLNSKNTITLAAIYSYK
ncbi:hypothetical protein BSF42_25130 [Flavobacterium sp. ACN6]|nr:hypothetical protein BSF42_25130 [Flavobacterium sp. ACN6]